MTLPTFTEILLAILKLLRRFEQGDARAALAKVLSMSKGLTCGEGMR